MNAKYICGGAESTDQAFRVEGISWFPEERIEQAQIADISSDKVDVVVSSIRSFGKVKGVKTHPRENVEGNRECISTYDIAVTNASDSAPLSQLRAS